METIILRMMGYGKYKILRDFIINIFSICFPTFILQIIILPLINKSSPDEYGLLITLMSLFSAISLPFSVSLNNSRLLLINEEVSFRGDYNIAFLASCFIDTLLLIVSYSLIIKDFNIYNLLFIIIVSWLNIYKEYAVVYFRINLKYTKVLINSLITSFGFIIGYFLYRLLNIWEFVFLVGFLSSSVYLLFETKSYKEKLFVSLNFKRIILLMLVLLISSFLGTLPAYFDKIVLYPLLGDYYVAVYYASTIFAKLISQIISPISSVILSYLIKSSSISMKKFIYVLLSIALVGLFGYAVCCLFSKSVLTYLYPDLMNESIKYVKIATISSIITVSFTIINSFVLRFSKRYFQIVIFAVGLISYLLFTLLFYDRFGFKGFYYGILLDAIFKLIIISIILIFTIKKRHKRI